MALLFIFFIEYESEDSPPPSLSFLKRTFLVRKRCRQVFPLALFYGRIAKEKHREKLI